MAFTERLKPNHSRHRCNSMPLQTQKITVIYFPFRKKQLVNVRFHLATKGTHQSFLPAFKTRNLARICLQQPATQMTILSPTRPMAALMLRLTKEKTELTMPAGLRNLIREPERIRLRPPPLLFRQSTHETVLWCR